MSCLGRARMYWARMHEHSLESLQSDIDYVHYCLSICFEIPSPRVYRWQFNAENRLSVVSIVQTAIAKLISAFVVFATNSKWKWKKMITEFSIQTHIELNLNAKHIAHAQIHLEPNAVLIPTTLHFLMTSGVVRNTRCTKHITNVEWHTLE